MEKKKQTFSISRVIKAVILFFVAVILIIPLLMGIDEKKIFPAQHEKEIKEWEEIVERSCNVSPDIREEYLPRLENGSLIMSLNSTIELMKKNPKYYNEEEIKEKKKELEEASKKIKYYCWGDNHCSSIHPVNQTKCIANETTLSNIKDENPPSIFYYYNKIIEYIMGSVISMFLILLTLILITLFEVHKLKNKNNIH